MNTFLISTIAIVSLLVISLIFTILKNYSKIKLISKASLNFSKKNFFLFFTFFLFLSMSLSITSSTLTTSQAISESINIATTKGAAPFSQLDMDSLYPKVEKKNSINSLDTDVKTWNGSIADTYYWDGNPNNDKTPSNLKDNAAWCNSLIWDYGTVDEHSPIRANPGLFYTEEFEQFTSLYPFAEIPGNEYLYCEYSFFESRNGSPTPDFQEAYDDVSLFYMIEAKMNVNVSIRGETYNLQISALPSPNEKNSFVMNDQFYYINNFFMSEGKDINDFEENKIYMVEGLSKDLGIKINDTLNITSKTRVKQDTYPIDVSGFGWNPEYIFLDDMFFNPDGKSYTSDLSPGDENILVGFVTAETFTNIAKKIYTNEEISKNDLVINLEGEATTNVNDSLFDYTLNISDINLIDAFEKGIYSESKAFDSSYIPEQTTSHKYDPNYTDFAIGYQGGSYYLPSKKKITHIRDVDVPDYYNNSIKNDTSSSVIWPTTASGGYMLEYMELSRAQDQSNFFNSLSITVLVTILIITTLVSLFIVHKICSYFRKKIGVLKSLGFDLTSIVLGINFSIFFTILISLLVSIAFTPLFSIMWGNLANQSLTTSIPTFGLSLKTFYNLMFLPSIMILLFSLLFTYKFTRANSLKLMKDVKTSKPSLIGIALDKTNLSKYSFINSYFLKNISNNLFRSFSMILIVSSFSMFLLLSLSANDLTKSTVESISAQMDMNFASINNTQFQKESYKYEEVFDENGNPKSEFQVIQLNIDTSKQIDFFTPDEYNTYIYQVRSTLEKNEYNGHQLFLVDELAYLDDLIRFAKESHDNAVSPEWANFNSPSYKYNNKLSTLGIHETDNKYLSLGFEVTNEDQLNLRIISNVSSDKLDPFQPYVEYKVDTSEVISSPEYNEVIPEKIFNNGSDTKPDQNLPNVNYEDLFSLSLFSLSYNQYELHINYSKAIANSFELYEVNFNNDTYDTTNPNWIDDTVNQELTLTFNNLKPDTTYQYNFTFKDSKNVIYNSSLYAFTTESEEFSTATGNHYTPGPEKVSAFSSATKYCTYSGEVDVEPKDNSFYIPFDPLKQNCVYDLQVNSKNEFGSVMLLDSNDMNSYVNMEEVNPNFDYEDYLNEVNKSDGKIPILIPNYNSKLKEGDTFSGMDFSEHGRDIFAPDATSFKINSNFYVYDSINTPVTYFGSLIPIDDPDFINNQSYNETTGNLETSGDKPINANSGNMLTKSFLSESNGGLISKSDGISDSYSTLSVGIRVKENDGSGNYSNSNLFDETLKFTLNELVNGQTSTSSTSTEPEFIFDANNTDKFFSNDNFEKISKLFYLISKIDSVSLNNMGSIILAINSIDFNNLTAPEKNSSGDTAEVINTTKRDPKKGHFTPEGVIYQNQIIDWYNDYMYYAMKDIEPNVYKLDRVTVDNKLGENLPYNLKNKPSLSDAKNNTGKIEVILLNLIDRRMVSNEFFVNDFYKSVSSYQNGYTYTPTTSKNPTDPTTILGIINADSMAGRSNTKSLIGRILSLNVLSNIQEFDGSYNEAISTLFSKTENVAISLDSLLYKITTPSLIHKQQMINSLIILGLILSASLMLIMLSMYASGSKKEINILKSIGWSSKSVIISNSYNVLVYAISILIAFLISGAALNLISGGLGFVMGTFPVSILLSTAAIVAISLVLLFIIISTFTYNIYKYDTTKIDRESIN